MTNSIFKRLSTADMFEKSKYFQEGKYEVQINKVKFIENGANGDSFVIEALILATESSAPNAPQPGELAAQVWNASGTKREMAISTWMTFVCSVLDCKQDEYTDEEWTEISESIIDDGKFEGIKMHLQVFETTTRKGNPYTQHKWRGQI